MTRLFAILVCVAACGSSSEAPHQPRYDRARVLAAAYDDLESALRPHKCAGCHVRDNLADSAPDVFTDLEHAVASRDAIVRMLEGNAMPPIGTDGRPGISDPIEREHLITVARSFAVAADDALAHGR